MIHWSNISTHIIFVRKNKSVFIFFVYELKILSLKINLKYMLNDSGNKHAISTQKFVFKIKNKYFLHFVDPWSKRCLNILQIFSHI